MEVYFHFISHFSVIVKINDVIGQKLEEGNTVLIAKTHFALEQNRISTKLLTHLWQNIITKCLIVVQRFQAIDIETEIHSRGKKLFWMTSQTARISYQLVSLDFDYNKTKKHSIVKEKNGENAQRAFLSLARLILFRSVNTNASVFTGFAAWRSSLQDQRSEPVRTKIREQNILTNLSIRNSWKQKQRAKKADVFTAFPLFVYLNAGVRQVLAGGSGHPGRRIHRTQSVNSLSWEKEKEKKKKGGCVRAAWAGPRGLRVCVQAVIRVRWVIEPRKPAHTPHLGAARARACLRVCEAPFVADRVKPARKQTMPALLTPY